MFNVLEYLYLSWLMIINMYRQFTVLNTRTRRWWTKPHITEGLRVQFGAHANIFTYFKLHNHEDFYKFCGMSFSQFEILFEVVRDKITKRSFRKPLEPELKLAAVLNFLANGKNVNQQSWFFRIGRSTMCKVIPEVCAAIYESLKDTYLVLPRHNDWISIAEDFNKKYSFPNCIGVIDGKHFRIRAPANSGSWFFNFRKFNSIVLMATCDANCRFTWASVGDFALNDTGVFAWSNLGEALEKNEIDLPGNKVLPGSDVVLPHFFLGDGGFPLKSYLMKPYRRTRYQTIEKRIFNIRLTYARKIIERAFGILCKKWKIFEFPQDWKLQTTEIIIMCTICLHNFIIRENMCEEQSDSDTYSDKGASNSISSEEDGIDSDSNVDTDTDTVSDNYNHFINNIEQILEPDNTDSEYESDEEGNDGDDDHRLYEIHDDDENAIRIRDALKDYFVSPAGNKPWQWQKLYR